MAADGTGAGAPSPGRRGDRTSPLPPLHGAAGQVAGRSAPRPDSNSIGLTRAMIGSALDDGGPIEDTALGIDSSDVGIRAIQIYSETFGKELDHLQNGVAVPAPAAWALLGLDWPARGVAGHSGTSQVTPGLGTILTL